MHHKMLKQLKILHIDVSKCHFRLHCLLGLILHHCTITMMPRSVVSELDQDSNQSKPSLKLSYVFCAIFDYIKAIYLHYTTLNSAFETDFHQLKALEI